jgi:hypothetical protein
MGRTLENTTRCGDHRRALGRIDGLYRGTLLLKQQQAGNDAVDLYSTLAERELLRRIKRRLHLRDILMRELLEIRPTEFESDLELPG